MIGLKSVARVSAFVVPFVIVGAISPRTEQQERSRPPAWGATLANQPPCRRTTAPLADQLADQCRLLRSHATDLHQDVLGRHHHTLYRTELLQETVRQLGTHSRKTLEHVQFARREPLRLAVVPLEKTTGHIRLIREIAKDAQRIFRIARVQHWKPPPHGERDHGSFQRMWVHFRQTWGCWPFQQDDGAMRTSGEGRRLREEPSIHERRCEIGIRLSLNDHAIIDGIIADRKPRQVDVEVNARAGKIQQCCPLLGKIDEETVSGGLHCGKSGH
jgi:hypothetical protein